MTNNTDSLGARLRRREPLVLTLSVLPSPAVVELLGLAGFDGVIFDMEHGPYTLDSVATCIAAAELRGLATLVRLPFEQRSLIGPLLDTGIAGIVVPHISTAAMAKEVADAARFLPVGTRGANPWVRAAEFAGDADYFARENERVAVIVQIEGREGLSNAAEIISTPGVDAVFVGPVDLSHALGIPNQLEHPYIVDAVAGIADLAHEASVAVCLFCATPEQVINWRARDVDVAIFGVDSSLILHGVKAQLDATQN